MLDLTVDLQEAVGVGARELEEIPIDSQERLVMLVVKGLALDVAQLEKDRHPRSPAFETRQKRKLRRGRSGVKAKWRPKRRARTSSDTESPGPRRDRRRDCGRPGSPVEFCCPINTLDQAGGQDGRGHDD